MRVQPGIPAQRSSGTAGQQSLSPPRPCSHPEGLLGAVLHEEELQCSARKSAAPWCRAVGGGRAADTEVSGNSYNKTSDKLTGMRPLQPTATTEIKAQVLILGTGRAESSSTQVELWKELLCLSSEQGSVPARLCCFASGSSTGPHPKVHIC